MNEEAFRKRLIEEIINTVRVIPPALDKALRSAARSAAGIEKTVLENIVRNCGIAGDEKVPVCQDTGLFEIWFCIGKNASIKGINFNTLADEALERAHREGKLRRSMEGDIKGVVHISFSEGKAVQTLITARGFGSENYTFLHSLPPGASGQEIKRAVAADIAEAAGRPCPPYVIGIGLGGTASAAAELSALALTEMDFSPSGLQREIMEEVNKAGPGAGGMGGDFSALGVKIKRMPAHIAGLQMCVHAGCWCNRVGRFCYEED